MILAPKLQNPGFMRSPNFLIGLAALCLPLALGAVACSPATAEDQASEDPNAEENLGWKVKNGAPLGPTPAGHATQLPIVLAHGFMGSASNLWSFYGVADALRKDGHIVHEAEVPPFADPEVRADFLAQHVDAALEEAANSAARLGLDAPTQVNIVAHSMGGLDSRVLASRSAYTDKIASITTISTPHGGSLVADVAAAVLAGVRASSVLGGIVDTIADDAANAFFHLLGGKPSSLLDQTNLRATLAALSVGGAKAFNDAHPNLDSIYYQTWAGVSTITGSRYATDDIACSGAPMLMHDKTMSSTSVLLVASSAIVGWNGLHQLKPNDGVSTVQSARGLPGFECDSESPSTTLGCFHFRGCFPADHLGEVGQPKHTSADLDTGFEQIRFYRNLAFDLAAKGY